MGARRLASSTSTASSSSFLDADLPAPSSDDSFIFGTNNSDMARQLYFRALAGDSAEQLDLTEVPAAVQGRLSRLGLTWDRLDGIAQRALLWDSGFGFSTDNKPVQIFTDGKHSMDDLTISIEDYEAVGCIALNCSQPDGTTSYSNLYCSGSQMLSATKCLIEELDQDDTEHTSMWSTGGSPDMIPTPRVVKHKWADPDTSSRPFTVLAIHTQQLDSDPTYGECPDRAQITLPKGSDWVSRWLVKNYTTTSPPATATPVPTQRTSTTMTNQTTFGAASIIGIVAACVVVVLAVIGFIFARRRQPGINNEGQAGLWNDDIITANRIPREKVRVVKLISRGAFGEVYTGTYNGHQVAVKMLLPSARRDMKMVNDFLLEAKLTASMEHPRIAACIGVAWDSLSDLCVVLELMEGGDLRTLLGKYDKSNHPVGFDREKATIALHVAHALTYLHSLEPPVIHRDLKSRNILLNELHEAKLTDFGISRERLDRTMTAGVGTSLWMAPEVMKGERYDDKADIFSFGVVLSELDTHSLPYAQARQEMQNSHGRQMTDATLLQKVAMGTVIVEFSSAGPKAMADLGYACVSVDSTMRPSAAEALFKLQVILSKELA